MFGGSFLQAQQRQMNQAFEAQANQMGILGGQGAGLPALSAYGRREILFDWRDEMQAAVNLHLKDWDK